LRPHNRWGSPECAALGGGADVPWNAVHAPTQSGFPRAKAAARLTLAGIFGGRSGSGAEAPLASTPVLASLRARRPAPPFVRLSVPVWTGV
jgi:hypothetical protein